MAKAVTFLREVNEEGFAGSLSWVLIVGYVLTNSVYAFTFGQYPGNVVGLGPWFPRVIAITIVAFFVGLNLRGVGEAGGVEVFLVWFKIVVLVGLARWGISKWNPPMLSEGVPEAGIGAALFGAASTGSAINATLFATARLSKKVADGGVLPAVMEHENAAGVPDRAVILLGLASAVLAAVGTLTTLVEAASLSFLFTFCVVSGLAFLQRAGTQIVTGFGALAAAAASIALVARLIRTDVLALAFLGLLVLIAIFGRPLLMRQTRR